MERVTDEPTLVFKLFNFIHTILTTWYFAELLLFVFVILAIIFSFIIFKDSKLYIFIIKDRYSFIKKYCYYFILEKIHFFKDFSYVMMKEYKKYTLISFILLCVVALLVYVFFWVIPSFMPSSPVIN